MTALFKKLTLTGANILFFIFSIVFIAYQLVLGVIFGEKLNDKIYIILLINEFVMVLAPVIIYCAVKKVNMKEVFRLHKPGLIPMLLVAAISVPAYFVALMLNNLVVFVLQYIGDIPAQPIPAPKNIPELILGLLIVAVVPGICEEIMHRGLLLSAYEKRGSYKAVIIVAIYFGIFHFDITNFFGPIFLGLIIGYYVVRTNSIFAGMFAHFLNNAIAELLQYFLSDGSQPEKMTVSLQELQTIILLGIICLFITAGLLVLFKRATEEKSVITPPIASVRNDVKSILSHWPVILVLILYIAMMLLYLLSIVMLKLIGGM